MSDPPSERVVTLDVVRGLAILGMVFLHNGAFHFARVEEALADPPPWLMAFGFLLLWAGLFGVVSGAANATTTLRRLARQAETVARVEKTERERPWRYPPSLTKGALQTFVILFGLHWVWTLGVGNSAVTADPSDPTLRVTLLPGLVYYGHFPRIHPENWVFASALWMIAANGLLVSLGFRVLYRRRPPRPDDSLERSLVLLGAAVLLATPFLRAALYGPMLELVGRGGASIAAAVPLALLVNDPNPVFPFFAYGLLGAVIGASLARGEPRAPLYRLMRRSGLALVACGGAGLWASGGLVLAGREEIWGQSALYFASLSWLLLGVFAWGVTALLALFDPPPDTGRAPWRPGWLPTLMRFGRLSLTVFLLEGILGMLMRVGLDALAPGWNDGLGQVLLFAVANLVVWHGILRVWERAGYRGSLEWMVARLRGADDRSRALRADRPTS